MATTRATAPPVNLKDRIAALQQRSNASAHGDGLSTPSLGPGSLRAKIASFERQGAVPTPRGRFGAGAPPVGDSSSKKKGELYGNRVPELAKPSPDGALEARKRTLSSTSRSRSLSRPTSPESELASGSELAPPLPSVAQVGRRIVSDVLPRTQTSLTDPSIDVKDVSAAEKTVVKASPTPAIVVQTDLKTSATEAQEHAISTSVKDDDEPNGGTTSPARSVKSQETIKAPSPPSNNVQEGSKDVLSQRSATQYPTDDTHSSVRATKPISLPLSRSPSSSDSDVADDVTASSDSVPTPSDNETFPISSSPKVEVPSIVLPTVGKGIKAVPEPLVEAPTPVVATISRTTPSSSPDVSVPPDSPGLVKVGRKATPSFHAVVHRKVRETALPEHAPAMPAPSRIPLTQPKTPAVSRVRAESVAEPLSPGLGDLAALMFDAAMLEEQLSGTSAPAKKSTPPPPTFNLQPAIPEYSEADVVKPSPVEEQKEAAPEAPCPPAEEEPSLPPAIAEPFLPPVVEERSLPPTPTIVPPMRRESIPTPRVFTTRDSLPARDPSVRQSVLRKQSLSRNSVYSEMSEESHVMVSRPSSPPGGSDASSVRSSSKSWKSPRKSIGRASSWLFRNKTKNSIVVTEEDTGSSDVPPSPSLLSPYLSGSARSTSGSSSSQPGSRRPSSRMSISSGGSGDMFDTELVSSFPSVPTGQAPHLRARTLPSAPPLPTDFAQSVGRAITVGHASGRQQQQLL